MPVDIIDRLISYWCSKRPDLQFSHDISYASYKHRFRVLHTKAQCGYIFEVERAFNEHAFQLELSVQFERAVKYIDKELQNKIDAFCEFSPFQLTMEEEAQLAEELRKVKEGFYANCRRDKKGNRLSKEDMERYKDMKGFADF